MKCKPADGDRLVYGRANDELLAASCRPLVSTAASVLAPESCTPPESFGIVPGGEAIDGRTDRRAELKHVHDSFAR